MQRTLYQHFVFLEERLLALRDQVTDPSCTSADIRRITSEIDVVEGALAHYRSALDLERTIGDDHSCERYNLPPSVSH